MALTRYFLFLYVYFRYGIVEFESPEKALAAMKDNNNEIEIEGNKVKLVRISPNPG